MKNKTLLLLTVGLFLSMSLFAQKKWIGTAKSMKSHTLLVKKKVMSC